MPTLRSLLSSGGLLLTLACSAWAGSAEQVVELPPLLVTESAKPLQWRYLETKDFQVLFICSDYLARDFVGNYHRLGQLMSLLVPEKFQVRMSVPLTLILFDDTEKRIISTEVIANMLKEERARTTRKPSPEALGKLSFLPNMRLTDRDAVTAFALLDDASEGSNLQFTREHFVAAIAHRSPSLPLWLVHGLIELYTTVHYQEDRLVFSPALWTSDEETRALARDRDYPRALLPLEEMLSLAPADYRPNTDFARLWTVEASLFVRWLHTANHGARREALWKFVERLEQEPLSEALFRECFGLGYADARDRLSDYLPQAIEDEFILKADKLEPCKPSKARLATDAEVGRLRGEWERLEIQHVKKYYPALTGKYLEQARRTLNRAYEREARDPGFLAVYGLCESEAGNTVRARELLEAATQAKVVRPLAYFELARLKFIEKTQPATAKLDDAAAAEILQLLQAGAEQNPALPESYFLMAEVAMRRSGKPNSAELAVLYHGAILFPYTTPLVARVISLHATQGLMEPARALVALGLRNAPNEHDRKFYETLRTQIAALEKAR